MPPRYAAIGLILSVLAATARASAFDPVVLPLLEASGAAADAGDALASFAPAGAPAVRGALVRRVLALLHPAGRAHTNCVSTGFITRAAQ